MMADFAGEAEPEDTDANTSKDTPETVALPVVRVFDLDHLVDATGTGTSATATGLPVPVGNISIMTGTAWTWSCGAHFDTSNP